MTRQRHDDPIQPAITFDSYVIPESVHAYHTPQPGFRINGTVLAVSVIALLTFTLGVMVTLFVTAPDRLAELPQTSGPDVTATAAHRLVETAAEEEVTRLAAADLITPSVQSGDARSQIPALEAAVLKGLQPERTVGKLTEEERLAKALEAQAIVSRNKMRMLREGVLAGVYTVTAREKNGTRRLVLETINAEMTRDSIGNLLRDAARRGEIVVPASLNTAEGGVDMDTLLFNLVQTSLATDGTPEGAEAAREMSRRAFAASSARTSEVKGKRVYTVERGDSLAYISLQFYGRPDAYLRIFDANRDQLSSPDLIKIGQRLIIPG